VILTVNKNRNFRAIVTPKTVTKTILLDDITQTIFYNFRCDVESNRYATCVIPYDKLNNAGGFSKINY